jgi:hypothetical protein
MADDAVFIPPVAAIPSRKSKDPFTDPPVFPELLERPQRKPRIKRMKAKIARVPSTPPKQRKPRAPKPEVGLTAFKVLLAFMKLDPRSRALVIELAKELP